MTAILEYTVQIVSKDEIPFDKQDEYIRAIDDMHELIEYGYTRNVTPVGFASINDRLITADDYEPIRLNIFMMSFRTIDAMPTMVRLLKGIYDVPMNVQCNLIENEVLPIH